MTRQGVDQTTRVRFGAFELDVCSGELRGIEPGDGEVKLLQEQPFRILQLLIERNGDVASRDDIRRVLWPDERNVDFNHSINVAIATLRRLLRDPATEAKYIETVARRGYRLIPAPAWLSAAPDLTVRENGPGPDQEPLHIYTRTPNQAAITPAGARERKTSIRSWAWLVAVIAALAAVTGGAWYWKLRPAMRLAANDTVVLADISNQTSDPVFEDALNTALRVEFEQTPYFNLLGSDKVRGTMKLHYRSQRRTETTLDDQEEDTFVGREPSALRRLEAKDTARVVRQILSELPERDRCLLQLVLLEARNKDEVCAEFGITREYLRVLLHRARQSFQSCYTSRFGRG